MTNKATLRSQLLQALENTQDISEIASAQLILGKSFPDVSNLLLKKLPVITSALAKKTPLVKLFAVLAALASAGKPIPGNLLAVATQRLIDCEVAPGGPYASKQAQVDLSANIHIYLFLDLVGARLPKLQEYIHHHPDPKLPSYCAYQAAKGVATTLPTPPTPLIALALQFAKHPTRQMPNPTPTDKKYAYLKTIAEYRLCALPEPLQSFAVKLFRRVIRADTTKEMLLLPYFFAAHVHSNISSSDIANICIANLFCWMGYTAFDDALDKKAVTQLPVAITAITLCKQIYTDVPYVNGFEKELYSIFLLMDQANALEISRRVKVKDGALTITALPKFSDHWIDIGAKSSGHILGALFQLQCSLLAVEQKEAGRKALQSYLIARQLQDDLFDWKEDLQNGYVTFAVNTILQDANVAPGKYQLSSLLPRLEATFWQKSLATLAAIIQEHTSISRHFFELHPSENEADMIQLIDRIELTAQQGVHANKNQKMFLRSFTGLTTE